MIKTKSKVFGERLEVGVIKRPASEDAAPENAQLSERVKLVLIPLSRATSEFKLWRAWQVLRRFS